jgi:GNAT superfamily N-acetyltransferase
MVVNMIRVRPMTAADLALGMRLKTQAGWNQTEADWRRALDLGACFVAELDGTPAGTVATCRFGPVAWIALMLVDAALRRRGVGRALMGHALDYLDAAGVTTVRLDATPLGRPLYESLGFAAEYTLARYEGTPQAAAEAAVTRMSPQKLDEVLALDRAATGTDREALLRRLAADRPDDWRVAERDGRVVGYLTSRPGANAVHIGPCAADSAVGPCLLADAFRRHSGGRVFVDVPDANIASIACVTAAGLAVQRPFVRMYRGSRIEDRPTLLWACAGPEKG